MKYLKKDPASKIIEENLTYIENCTTTNRRLRELLEVEQNHFCAYTEKKISNLDSVEVEHFDPKLKGHDDYYNYYAVIRCANQKKTAKERKKRFSGAPFFESRFFQKPAGFADRIAYVAEDHVYEERSEKDEEAKMFIDYLSLNDFSLVVDRTNHISRLRALFDDSEALKAYLTSHPEETSFPTAIEAAFGITLTEVSENDSDASDR